MAHVARRGKPDSPGVVPQSGGFRILLANLKQAAGRLVPADWKSGLGAFGRLSACADSPNRAKPCPRRGICGGTPSELNLFGVIEREAERRIAVSQQYRFSAGRAWPQKNEFQNDFSLEFHLKEVGRRFNANLRLI